MSGPTPPPLPPKIAPKPPALTRKVPPPLPQKKDPPPLPSKREAPTLPPKNDLPQSQPPPTPPKIEQSVTPNPPQRNIQRALPNSDKPPRRPLPEAQSNTRRELPTPASDNNQQSTTTNNSNSNSSNIQRRLPPDLVKQIGNSPTQNSPTGKIAPNRALPPNQPKRQPPQPGAPKPSENTRVLPQPTPPKSSDTTRPQFNAKPSDNIRKPQPPAGNQNQSENTRAPPQHAPQQSRPVAPANNQAGPKPTAPPRNAPVRRPDNGGRELPAVPTVSARKYTLAQKAKAEFSDDLIREFESTNEKRLKIVKEIQSTEETYLVGLDVMVNEYMEPMLIAAETELLPQTLKDDVKIIFSNVAHLLPINKVLLESVEQRINTWTPTQKIGDIFVKMAPFFRIYNNYQNNYEKAIATLTKCQSNEAFVQFTEKVASSNKGKGTVSLEGLLIQPIQRIPRYILLLTELGNKTPTGHPDKQHLTEAAAELEKVMTYLDQDITSQEYREKFLTMSTKINGASNLIKAHRVLIAEGSLHLKPKNATQNSSAGGIKKKLKSVTGETKLRIWLFNDVLVHLKSNKSSKKTNVSSTEYTWPLPLVWIKDYPEPDPTDPKMPYTFLLVGPIKTYTVRFAEENEKKEWIQRIRSTVQKVLNEEIAPDDDHRYCDYTFPDKHGAEYSGWWKFGRIHGQGKFKIFGNTYTGDWEYNRKNGQGSFVSLTGETYTGEWKDDRPHGYGHLEYTNKDRYEGEWSDGLRHGRGIHYYVNGDVYDGEWICGVPSGSGSFTSAKGLSYIGNWLNGKLHGYGCLISPNGRRYDGEFKDGLKSGEGKMDFSNGDFYIGQWLQDQKHGFGIFFSSIEGIFEGHFVRGLKEGHGKMTYKNGDVYEGHWKRDLFHDKGTFTPAKGGGLERYEGTWENGKMNGKGFLAYPTGAKLECSFKENRPHGTGTILNKNGTAFEGKWENGKREGKATITTSSQKFSSACVNSMMGKREASFLVPPDIPSVIFEL